MKKPRKSLTWLIKKYGAVGARVYLDGYGDALDWAQKHLINPPKRKRKG